MGSHRTVDGAPAKGTAHRARSNAHRAAQNRMAQQGTARAAAKNPRVVLNEEGREYQWLTLPAAKKLNLNRPTKILIEAVLRQSRRKKK